MADVLAAERHAGPAESEPLGPRNAGLPMTLEEFEGTDYERGYRYELIHGVLIVTPAPAAEERSANQTLGYWLLGYRERHRQGRALDLTLPEQDVRTPAGNRRCDRAIWAGLGRHPQPGTDVPTILVEFVSARTWDRRRDYVEKRDEYLAVGVQEYWILDRFARRMVVLTRKGAQWVETSIPADGVHTTPLLPGFEVKLSALLAVGDRYAR